MAIFSSPKVGKSLSVVAQLDADTGYSEKPQLPLRNEVIRAYRAYSLTWENARPLLKGSRESWPTIDKVATCGDGLISLCEQHLATLQCTCGVYALTERVDAYEGNVTADVVLFGIVWPHTKGYKASKARIESMVYHPASDSAWEQEIVNALADRYGVPVALGEKRKAMTVDYSAMMAQGMPSPIPSSYFQNQYQQPASYYRCGSCGATYTLKVYPGAKGMYQCQKCGFIQ